MQLPELSAATTRPTLTCSLPCAEPVLEPLQMAADGLI